VVILTSIISLTHLSATLCLFVVFIGVHENKNIEDKKKNKIILAHMWRGIMYFINHCRFIKYIIHGLVFLYLLRRCLRRNLTSEMCVVH
jgi:hypothetical protein